MHGQQALSRMRRRHGGAQARLLQAWRCAGAPSHDSASALRQRSRAGVDRADGGGRGAATWHFARCTPEASPTHEGGLAAAGVGSQADDHHLQGSTDRDRSSVSSRRARAAAATPHLMWWSGCCGWAACKLDPRAASTATRLVLSGLHHHIGAALHAAGLLHEGGARKAGLRDGARGGLEGHASGAASGAGRRHCAGSHRGAASGGLHLCWCNSASPRHVRRPVAPMGGGPGPAIWPGVMLDPHRRRALGTLTRSPPAISSALQACNSLEDRPAGAHAAMLAPSKVGAPGALAPAPRGTPLRLSRSRTAIHASQSDKDAAGGSSPIGAGGSGGSAAARKGNAAVWQSLKVRQLGALRGSHTISA